MDILRTPDDRFVGLADYPFAPRYVEVDAGDGSRLRVHYLDEGSPDAEETVLLLHGEPSWSYLYRKMIPVLNAAGLRAIAVDLVGFGRSDKPAQRRDYTYQNHVDWTWAAVDAVGLDAITLVCQDWGGLIGLRLVGEHPERFARVVAANTFLPTGDRPPSDAFLAWQHYSQDTSEFQVGRIVRGGCVTDLPPEVVAAYDAPSPTTPTNKAPASSPCSSRPDPRTRPPRPTGPPGTTCAASSGHSCAPSPTPTPSPEAPTPCCEPRSRVPPESHMPPWPAPDTSSKKTKAKNSPESSPSS